jgi:cardiolipin synthase
MDRGRKLVGPVQDAPPARSAGFAQATGTLLGQGYKEGNGITTLVNGREIFPAMLAAIRSAKKSVNFETYVFEDGEVARNFTDALSERARAGVKVHVMLDAQGAKKAGARNVDEMRAAGVQIVNYHTAFRWDLRRFNNRTHRKLLVVDGRVGFIGGVGIADEWSGDAGSPEHWRDNHYRVTGPVVGELQGLFLDHWLKTKGELSTGPDYFPPLASAGPYRAQAFKSSPEFGGNSVSLMYHMALASARKSILVENAYFVPDEMARRDLMDAARRGVRVEVLVPGPHIDQKIVLLASQRHWPELIKAGVRIYEYQPTMVHVKLLIIDGVFTSVGSANFDNRSARLNDEANLNVISAGFAAEQARLFENDKRHSRQAGLNEKGKLAPLDGVAQQAAGIASPQL